ncbi:MAG: 50S ribosomal protein L9 [Clostridia bacterium]|nr:50S ribosomal protein L9 [Clostridia bacterium]
MKVILQQDVKGTGKKGDMVTVAEGYARNFLLPKKLAIPATDANVNQIRQQQDKATKQKAQELAEAQKLADRLAQVTVTVIAKCGEGGRLFGSVTAKEITEILAEEHKLKVDKRKIELKEPIKALGVYNLTFKLHPQVQGNLKVQVTESR